MPGPLRNERHERFAHELAKGTLQKDAYRLAGYRGGENQASRLAADERVRARIAELLARAASKAEITVADIARQLDEDRKLAHDVKQPGAAVSASLGKAKLYGLYREKFEHTGKDGEAIDINVKVNWVEPAQGD